MSRLAWRAAAYRAVRPILFRFDPERIHRVTMRALMGTGGDPIGRRLLALAGGAPARTAPVDLLGLRFRNRVGLGAGFDKDGEALRGWAALGFGFAEVGTVTPLPQQGNPRPRLFRLARDEALINRMGFNNAGAAALARHVMLGRRDLPAGFVVGVSIGRNRQTPPEQATEDYLAAHRLVAPIADYVAVNVSSPNTPGLRELQDPAALVALLEALDAAETRRVPLLAKLALDLPAERLDALLRALCDSPARGIVLGNTVATRDRLRTPPPLSDERGGLSGRPLRGPMLAAVERARELVQARMVVIASGGIASGEEAAAAIDAGADLVQLWTGLIYRGPGLVGEAVRATS